MMRRVYDLEPKRHLTADDVTESGTFRFATEASDLGWRVGFTPAVLTTTLGNGQNLYLNAVTEHKATYWQHLGCVSVVVYLD